MIESCIKLVKRYPYVCMGFVGIGLMVVPLFVVENLKRISTIHPMAQQIISPLMTSPAIQNYYGIFQASGLVIVIIAILLNNRTDSPKEQ